MAPDESKDAVLINGMGTNGDEDDKKKVVVDASFAVSADDMERELNMEERTAVRVVRQAGPSVAFVTSVWPYENAAAADSSAAEPPRRRRQRRFGFFGRRRQRQEPTNPSAENNTSSSNLPPGMSLGSGSAFVVDEQGYLVTNYHVIEAAHQLQRMDTQMRQVWQQVVANVSQAIPGFNLTEAARFFVPSAVQQELSRPAPSVFVRFVDGTSSPASYKACRIVDVQPDLDVAVLQIQDLESDVLPAMTFGASSNLLVGQGLIAIGNPFGLDNTVTTGVVSALNREIRAGGGGAVPRAEPSQPIRNCIQTDCAINPGNSGGPLLNLQGQVVGVNTAIVSTTGSFAGIGFAVPSDAVQPVVERIIRKDKLHNPPQSGNRRTAVPWMGVQILQNSVGGADGTAIPNVEAATLQRYLESSPLSSSSNWIYRVADNSPAQQAGMRGFTWRDEAASVVVGDAVVAIGGNVVTDFTQLHTEMEQRRVGEQVAVTLQDGVTSERRVVYLVLAEKPDESTAT